MHRRAICVLFLAACAAPTPEPSTAIDTLVLRQRPGVERWFGAPFPRAFAVEVCPDRAAFDASLPPQWGIAPTQCWMVASGVGDALRVLDPAVWSSQACEHDGADPEHVREIVLHELVHVFHGQHNASPDFSDAEDLDWFIEGLAVLASGQLDGGHLAPASQAVATGAAPERLAGAWSGKFRYAVCGTLVRELELHCGRANLLGLLAARTNTELLGLAGLSEDELLARWHARQVVDGSVR